MTTPPPFPEPLRTWESSHAARKTAGRMVTFAETRPSSIHRCHGAKQCSTPSTLGSSFCGSHSAQQHRSEMDTHHLSFSPFVSGPWLITHTGCMSIDNKTLSHRVEVRMLHQRWIRRKLLEKIHRLSPPEIPLQVMTFKVALDRSTVPLFDQVSCALGWLCGIITSPSTHNCEPVRAHH
jgi:hypothetical protein